MIPRLRPKSKRQVWNFPPSSPFVAAPPSFPPLAAMHPPSKPQIRRMSFLAVSAPAVSFRTQHNTRPAVTPAPLPSPPSTPIFRRTSRIRPWFASPLSSVSCAHALFSHVPIGPSRLRIGLPLCVLLSSGLAPPTRCAVSGQQKTARRTERFFVVGRNRKQLSSAQSVLTRCFDCSRRRGFAPPTCSRRYQRLPEVGHGPTAPNAGDHLQRIYLPLAAIAAFTFSVNTGKIFNTSPTMP